MSGDYIFDWSQKTVYSAVFNSRSDLVLTASMDGTAKLWDVKTGRCLGTLFGHKEGVKYAIFSPDSKMVITASFDKTAIIWDTKTCREICCIKGHRDSVDFACFSPNGEFAVSHSHNVIKLWRVSSFCEIGTILGYNISRTPLCFSSDSKKLITIGDDDTLSIWDVNSCERIFDLDCQAEGVTFASFCKDEDEKMVLIASDVDLKVWDVVNRREICRLQNSTHFSYFDYAELYQNERVITESFDEIALWDIKTQKKIGVVSHNERDMFFCTSSTGNIILTIKRRSNKAYLWNILSLSRIGSLYSCFNSFTALCYMSSEKRIVTSDCNNELCFWDIENKKKDGSVIIGTR